MTVKELYDWCKNRNIENCELLIEYACSDDYYSFSETIKESNLWKMMKASYLIRR